MNGDEMQLDCIAAPDLGKFEWNCYGIDEELIKFHFRRAEKTFSSMR